jgi:hypothetical protein
MLILGYKVNSNEIYRKYSKFLGEIDRQKCCQLGVKVQVESKMKTDHRAPKKAKKHIFSLVCEIHKKITATVTVIRDMM